MEYLSIRALEMIIISHSQYVRAIKTVDIEEYAPTIGLDLNQHPDLAWLARDGLKAPLPKGWNPW